ncbi:amidase [Amycolatopsis rhabdoformis]|uniref:Amidase n=1 Tax=Amycolatopsis rhabdoformis TaxID=1448059 RepID=A0ABZ1IJU8_9PSEU|nr:amidase [Amycolatopsis rhabdoformis]WSE33730.1 amidase [Amycolatopsis rhabdoformis]
MDGNLLSANRLAAALRAGEVSAVELAESAIARIGKYDGAVNAICVPDFDRALDAAREADAARARGEDGPLLGVPITVKESYNVAGLATTWGMPPFAGFVPSQDALPVARLKDAGAVLLGKTNVPLALGDLQSYNDLYGTTANPWDLGRTPGGSSGGSAAALAAGFGALSLGSDIGGSLRTPAHFCGVYAHKPSLGLLPSRGHTPPPAPALPTDIDLAVIGPMARSAADLGVLLDLLAEPDPLTLGVAYDLRLPPARHDRPADFRVLVLDEHPDIPTSAGVRAGIGRVAEVLTAAGARVDRGSALVPDLAESARLYLRLLFAVFGTTFPAELYDRFGELLADLAPGDDSLAAARVRGTRLTHRDWFAADQVRERHRHAWRAVFAEYDVVVCPPSPTPAFPHDQSPHQDRRRLLVDGVEHPYGDQIVWAGVATLPGLPVTIVPTGLDDSGPHRTGLPVGAQLIGPMFEDRTPLRLAELLEPELGGFVAPDLERTAGTA